MENEALQRFCDDVEYILNSIRGELLIYQQDSDTFPRFAAHTEKLGSLLDSVEMCEAVGIDHSLGQLRSQTSALRTATGRIPGDDIRSILDRISDIESEITLVRMSDADFSDELDRLLDTSLGSIQQKALPTAEPEAVATDPNADDRFEIDNELLEIFAGEADELLTSIDLHLQTLVSDPANKDSLWQIRRAAHTFKGSSGLVGLADASRLAHRIEDLLDELSEDCQPSTEGIVPVLISASKCLREMTDGIRSNQLEHDLKLVHAEFDRLSGFTSASQPANPIQKTEARETGAEPARKPKKPIVRVPLEQLDALVDLVRELVINRSVVGQRFIEFDRQVDELHNTTRRLRSVNNQLEVDLSSAIFDADIVYRQGSSAIHGYGGGASEHKHEHFHPLEIDRYNELHESIRDLAETAADTATIDQAIEGLREQFSALLRQQGTIFDEIQARVMSMRLVPFATLQTRLERAVRVTCEDEKKQALLTLENGGIELDTQMLEEIVEPLLHLLKNAVVHGIELPETRRLLGKAEAGEIVVRVDHQDTHVLLTVSDDGSGIALNSLKERAIASGDIDRESAKRISDHDALQMIFKPGLTTARRLNLNAGRGVGMNIVKESIESNNGTIAVATEIQRGTSFTIRLPLKLAVTNALLISSAGGTYAVPIKHIERIVEIQPSDLCDENGRAIWKTSEQDYPFHWLDESLGLDTPGDENPPAITALIVKSLSSRYAIGVSGVVRTEEVVIKPIAKPFDGIRDVLGIAFISSGELAPILDLPNLFGRTAKKPVEKAASQRPLKKNFVMVVDDSPSVRHMTTRAIRNAGCDVIAAKDGLDAMEMLNSGTRLPDLILTDIEMPRMGGFELARVVRDSTLLNAIPVVVVTSRSAEKHRQKAKEHGVDAYLVKPYEESELIGLVRSLTAATRTKEVESIPAG